MSTTPPLKKKANPEGLSESVGSSITGTVSKYDFSSLPDDAESLVRHDLGNIINKIYFQSSVEGESPFGSADFDGTWTREDIGSSFHPDEALNAFEALWDEEIELEEYDEPLNLLQDFANDGVPEYPRALIDRTLNVYEAAKKYEEMRNSENTSVEDSIELKEFLWAFEWEDSIELDEYSDMEIQANEAAKYIPDTLVKNMYDHGESGNVSISDEGSEVTITFEDISEEQFDEEELFMYDPHSEGGMGLPITAYLMEQFGGEVSYEGDEDAFRLEYRFQKV